MQGGSVDELLCVAVERLALNQLKVEDCCTLEDRVQSDLTGDHREERHLDVVDQTSGHQRPVQQQVPWETCVVVVSFMVVVPFSLCCPLGRPSWAASHLP